MVHEVSVASSPVWRAEAAPCFASWRIFTPKFWLEAHARIMATDESVELLSTKITLKSCDVCVEMESSVRRKVLSRL